ncbi:MAG: aspartyl/glutamyl-tRNA amidotransferase subunit C [Bacilli bacterium]|nr:aspartyl/glutamyl-tRNA amidotransferase subunit C [Bacilli bacterium]
MKKIDQKVLQEQASRLLFDIDENQIEEICTDLNDFLSYIQEHDISSHLEGIEPLFYPVEKEKRKLREDKEKKPLSVSRALKNSHTKEKDYILLPRVVGEEDE